jgi:hypothetical protein
MLRHVDTVNDLHRLLQTGPDRRLNKLNELILERVLVGKDNPEQFIGLSERTHAKIARVIDRVIENEKTSRDSRDSRVAYYHARAKCDKEKKKEAKKAQKAIEKQDRERNRLIAEEEKKRAAQLFAPPEPGDNSDDDCEYVAVLSDDESSDDEF